MKVVAFNGSPKEHGNTYHALKVVCAELEQQGIETEIVSVGGRAVHSCRACNACVRNQDRRCILEDDVNGWIAKMAEADGILLGSPVHYAGISAGMKAFLDRAFYVSSVNGSLLRHKVGAAVVAVRRTGGMPAFDQLNHYLLYSEMVLPTSSYWNVIHGLKPGEVDGDAEGMQIMRALGKNMAWVLQSLAASRDTAPALEPKVFTNFIR